MDEYITITIDIYNITLSYNGKEYQFDKDTHELNYTNDGRIELIAYPDILLDSPNVLFSLPYTRTIIHRL